MSEWEEIFGEGISAESVIDGINASSSREEKEAAKKAKKKRFLESMAYWEDGKAKEAFLKELKDAAASDPWPFEGCTLATLLRVPECDFAMLAERYRIPEPLSALIHAIFCALWQ